VVGRCGLAARVGADAAYFCRDCRNRDQNRFRSDERTGDTICMECGMVVAAEEVHQGSWVRSFEDEHDETQHGTPLDPLFSSSTNLATTIGAASMKGSKALRNAQAKVEMQVSRLGKRRTATRVAYKDRQKRDAFDRIMHVAGKVPISAYVVQLAKRYFAVHRNLVEALHNFPEVVAACIIRAYNDVVSDAMRATTRPGEAGGDHRALADAYAQHGTTPATAAAAAATVIKQFRCDRCRRTFAKQSDFRWHSCWATAADREPISKRFRARRRRQRFGIAKEPTTAAAAPVDADTAAAAAPAPAAGRAAAAAEAGSDATATATTATPTPAAVEAAAPVVAHASFLAAAEAPNAAPAPDAGMPQRVTYASAVDELPGEMP